MKILLLDNYDSFTYNLYHLVEKVCESAVISVVRNDRISIEEVNQFDSIILSPGPGIPSEAGKMPEIINEFRSLKPILGVCLGHQALAESFGGKLKNLSKVYHGVPAMTTITQPDVLYHNMPSSFITGRYHSWAVESPLPDELIASAVSEDGEIMSFHHRDLPVFGIQYHPESILSEYGDVIIRNWYDHALSKIKGVK